MPAKNKTNRGLTILITAKNLPAKAKKNLTFFNKIAIMLNENEWQNSGIFFEILMRKSDFPGFTHFFFFFLKITVLK